MFLNQIYNVCKFVYLNFARRLITYLKELRIFVDDSKHLAIIYPDKHIAVCGHCKVNVEVLRERPGWTSVVLLLRYSTKKSWPQRLTRGPVKPQQKYEWKTNYANIFGTCFPNCTIHFYSSLATVHVYSLRLIMWPKYISCRKLAFVLFAFKGHFIFSLLPYESHELGGNATFHRK